MKDKKEKPKEIKKPIDKFKPRRVINSKRTFGNKNA